MLGETAPLLPRQQKHTSRWQSVYWLYTSVLFVALSSSFINVPITQLVENNICSQYYQQSALTDRKCKTDKIQSKVAYLIGNLNLGEAVVGLLVAFPFGTLADRIGRKPVLILSITGSTLTTAWELGVIALPKIINIQAALAGPLLTVIGGGNTVLLANMYSIASDLADQSDRASTFFLMAFAALVGGAIGPAISSKLMDSYIPWVPAILGLFINMLSLVPLIFVPETLSSTKNDIGQGSDEIDSEQPHPRSLRFQLSQSFNLFLASFSALRSYSLIIVSSIFLNVAPDLIATSQFMAQYISKRFGWSLAKAGYLITLRGAIHLIVLLFILPLLSKILLRYHNPAKKDLILARVSIVFTAAGALLMAAPQIGAVIAGLAVHSLGSGQWPLLRSLAISYVPKEDTSKINTIIGMAEMSGTLFAGPVLAWSFDAGMKLGGILLGLPYFGLTESFALCFIRLSFVRSPISESNIPS